MKILIVDDETDLARAASLFLTRHGHEVVVASGARSGTATLARERFGAVLTDMRMPDGSGLDVLRAAMEQDNDPLRMVMTGTPLDANVAEARRLGVLRIFAKPVRFRDVLAVLEAAKVA